MSEQLCDFGCRRVATHQFKNGKFCCEKITAKCPEIRKINSEKNKGKIVIITEEQKEKLRKANIGKVVSEETKNKLKQNIPWNKGKHFSVETRKRMSISASKKRLSESHKRNIGNKRKGQKHTQESKEKIRQKNIGKYVSKETKEKMSKSRLVLYKDEKFLEKYRRALLKKPNKPEIILLNLLNEIFPKIYEYVGDYSFWIDGKNPDFVNKSKNKIIEYFGGHWHDKEVTGKSRDIHERERIEHFEKNGYSTLVIWDKEIEDINKLIKKIISFERS